MIRPATVDVSVVIIALAVAAMLTLRYSDDTDSGMTIEQHAWFQ